MNHDGHFYLGGTEDTPELVRQAADIASHVRPGGHVQDPRFPVGQAVQGVPVCSDGLRISGLFLGDVFLHRRLSGSLPRLRWSFCGGVGADGCPNRRWRKEARQGVAGAFLVGHSTGLERAKFKPWPPDIVDAYTADIRKGLPLRDRLYQQVVGDLGMRYPIPTPAIGRCPRCPRSGAGGRHGAELDLLRRCLRRWCNNNIVCILALYPRIRKRIIFMQNSPQPF